MEKQYIFVVCIVHLLQKKIILYSCICSFFYCMCQRRYFFIVWTKSRSRDARVITICIEAVHPGESFPLHFTVAKPTYGERKMNASLSVEHREGRESEGFLGGAYERSFFLPQQGKRDGWGIPVPIRFPFSFMARFLLPMAPTNQRARLDLINQSALTKNVTHPYCGH